jgi:cell division protein ZapA (FtsZ GTPase activity inhibitor)
MVETLRITITIAGKVFSVIVPRNEEEIYRKAASLLNQKIEEYRRRNPNADESYIVAQSAFYMSLRLQMLTQVHRQDVKAISDICDEIEAMLPSENE